MIDLSSYDVEVKKALTQNEFDERIEKGLMKSGETVDVYDNYGNIVKPKQVVIPPPCWSETVKKLKKDNWQDKHQLRVIYKHDTDLWNCMKENNIIPKTIVDEIERSKE